MLHALHVPVLLNFDLWQEAWECIPRARHLFSQYTMLGPTGHALTQGRLHTPLYFAEAESIAHARSDLHESQHTYVPN